MRRYKMIARKQVEVPFYTRNHRQRGRGFGSLEQIFERSPIPILRKKFVPALKSVAAEVMEFAVPEKAEFVSGRETSIQLQKMGEGKNWENSRVGVTGSEAQ